MDIDQRGVPGSVMTENDRITLLLYLQTLAVLEILDQREHEGIYMMHLQGLW